MKLGDQELDLLFREARTHSAWLDKPVENDEIHALYDLLCMGPTSANSSPARFLFLRGAEAKARLLPHLSEGNQEKTKQAPVTVLIANDFRFYEKLDKLFPHDLSARSWFEGNEANIQATAFRNGTLQGAYLILAARSLGLDCGAMSGFDNAGVDREFFPEGHLKSNFLCNIGHGDHSQLPPRNPRLAFDEAAQIL